MSVCRTCGADIIWAETESGKRMPLDRAPVIPKGLFVLTARPGQEAPLASSVASSQTPALYQSHFATCPQADEHRR